MQQMNVQNDALHDELTELNVSVNERKHVHQDNSMLTLYFSFVSADFCLFNKKI